jgi:hypothetical protein
VELLGGAQSVPKRWFYEVSRVRVSGARTRARQGQMKRMRWSTEGIEEMQGDEGCSWRVGMAMAGEEDGGGGGSASCVSVCEQIERGRHTQKTFRAECPRMSRSCFIPEQAG